MSDRGVTVSRQSTTRLVGHISATNEMPSTPTVASALCTRCVTPGLHVLDVESSLWGREPRRQRQAPPAAAVDPSRQVAARGSETLRVARPQKPQQRFPRRELMEQWHSASSNSGTC
ncbi:hypothetical protein GCM10023317_33200 [Actinopolymorpha pittospori]